MLCGKGIAQSGAWTRSLNKGDEGQPVLHRQHHHHPLLHPLKGKHCFDAKLQREVLENFTAGAAPALQVMSYRRESARDFCLPTMQKGDVLLILSSGQEHRRIMVWEEGSVSVSVPRPIGGLLRRLACSTIQVDLPHVLSPQDLCQA